MTILNSYWQFLRVCACSFALASALLNAVRFMHTPVPTLVGDYQQHPFVLKHEPREFERMQPQVPVYPRTPLPTFVLAVEPVVLSKSYNRSSTVSHEQDRVRLNRFSRSRQTRLSFLRHRCANKPITLHDPINALKLFWGSSIDRMTQQLHKCTTSCSFSSKSIEPLPPSVRIFTNQHRPRAPSTTSGLVSAVVGLEFLTGTDAHDDLTNIDLLVSVSPHSDVPVNYMYAIVETCGCASAAECVEKDRLFCLPTRIPSLESFSIRAGGAFVIASAWISNCGSHDRIEFLSRLLQLIPIHSYGACMRTSDGLLPAPLSRTRLESKVYIASQYPFLLSFENSLVDGYVTEKFFEGLVAGVIPVVWASPNIKTVLPSALHGAFIHAQEYEDPQSLAQDLWDVAHDQARFASYFAWKSIPNISMVLFELARHSFAEPGSASWMCRLCMFFQQKYCV